MKKKKKTSKIPYKGYIEHEWLVAHPKEVAKYAGQYIAVVGKKIVAHGHNFEKVYATAKKHGEDPVFDKVLPSEVVVYGTI